MQAFQSSHFKPIALRHNHLLFNLSGVSNLSPAVVVPPSFENTAPSERGIYLATCFLHLMPDTRVKMDSVMKNMGSNTTYAVPELLVMSGFYAVVFVEQIIK
ncbi:hypothetical protein Btru_017150, partial [Bulinus truncatus]